MAKNKIIYGNEVLLDLTGDSVTAQDVQSGVSFHLPSGEASVGTCTYDSDTSEDTAVVAEVLASKTFHARGSALTGTMPNNGGASGTISTKDGEYTIAQGFHDGSGKVQIALVERQKLVPQNIKAGVVLMGVTGDYSGEAVNVQTKTVTPATTAQTVLPDTGFDYLSEVEVNAIPYVETPNSAGGVTVTIAG